MAIVGADLERARAALAHWITHSGVQLAAGPQAGGVAGWIGPDPSPRYAYPEITGYFLQWCAARARAGDAPAPLAVRAAAAQRWLARVTADGALPATRVYLDVAPADWRNDAVFTFDLAMLLRGVAAAADAGLVAADLGMVTTLADALQALVAPDGRFAPCRQLRGDAALPQRWSTRRGAFLAKAAAGVLDAADTLPLPAALVAAAQVSFDADVDALLATPHDETHPYLYGIEGFLARPRDPRYAARLPAVAAGFARRIAAIDTDGQLAESGSERGQPRLDIVAQALRAALLLRGALAADVVPPARLAAFAATLQGALTPEGALPFVAGTLPQYNAWTAMFAEQALALAAADGPAHARAAARPCIV